MYLTTIVVSEVIELFQNIINITIPVSISIVMLLLFKKTCLKRIPAKWHLLLWIPVLFQLMIPIQIKVPVSSKASQTAVQIQNTAEYITHNMEQVFEQVIIKEASNTFFIHPQMIWIAGIVILLVQFIRSAWLLNVRIQEEAEECLDDRVLNYTNPYHLKPVILPHIHSAALPLTRWDLLILSKELLQLCDSELELIIKHELLHIKYHHRLISLLLHLLKVIYWYNPFIYLMYFRIHQEMEMMCDESIIEQNYEKIEHYGRLLIDMQAGFTSFQSIALSKKARNTKERLRNLMNKKHKTTFVLAIVLLIMGLSVLPLLAQEKTAPEQMTTSDTILSEVSDVPQKLSIEEFISMMVHPVDSYKITCQWGCYAGHNGTDVINPTERYGNVYAVYSGIVVETGYDSESGNYIIIDHQNGYQTHYHHLSEIYVTINQEVQQKERIALIGETGIATGPHLHLELTFDNTSINIDSLFGE
ncbi:MAG: peptidoglycan DD-metalloendopeptidase family protein [Erysipelotrichaceae bacterium]|nr:peptidoglycan DD-metalloendopeptidase family protein [Erysipelotrichaceae bacterium]